MHRPSPYLMRDFNGRKVDAIMAFNLVDRRARSRSILEFSLFVGALAGYLSALAFAA
ncbi:MAG: hypothetical protein PVF93_11550 [Chromatiaceae bacterium]